MKVVPAAEMANYVGTQFEPGEWITLDQDRINTFADCTEDHQFIHIDEEAAAKTPFGGTIAHGFLTLSDRGILATVVNGVKELVGIASSTKSQIEETESAIAAGGMAAGKWLPRRAASVAAQSGTQRDPVAAGAAGRRASARLAKSCRQDREGPREVAARATADRESAEA